MHSFANHNCIHASINKHPIIKLDVATSQSYSSFVYSVKHTILGGYGARLTTSMCVFIHVIIYYVMFLTNKRILNLEWLIINPLYDLIYELTKELYKKYI